MNEDQPWDPTMGPPTEPSDPQAQPEAEPTPISIPEPEVQPLPDPEPTIPTGYRRKRKRKGPSKEEFAVLVERVALVLGAEAVAVSSPLGSGRNRVFVIDHGEPRILEGVPEMTTREAYAFLQGLAYPRPTAGQKRP